MIKKIKKYGNKLSRTSKKVILGCLAAALVFTGMQFPRLRADAADGYTMSYKTIEGTAAKLTMPNGANSWWGRGIGQLKITETGETAFCIEPMVLGVDGVYKQTTAFPHPDLQDKLGLIAYYGWEKTAKSEADYAATQFMIWEAMGTSISWTGTFESTYNSMKPVIQAKVDKHYTYPNFGDTSKLEVKVGETLTLTDANGVIGDYTVTDEGGATVSIEGNQLKITPNADTDEKLKISFQKVAPICTGTTLAFLREGMQDVAVFKVGDPLDDFLDIKVLKYGKVEIGKQDEDGNWVENTGFKVSYNADMSESTTYYTGSNGKVESNDLLPQDIYIQEVSVPSHLVLDSTIQKATIISNDVIKYNAKNKWVSGKIKITKKDAETGKVVTASPTIFDVYNADTNVIVETLNTGTKGTATTGNLRYGAYYKNNCNICYAMLVTKKIKKKNHTHADLLKNQMI